MREVTAGHEGFYFAEAALPCLLAGADESVLL